VCNSDLTGVVTRVRELQSVEHHRAGVSGSITLLRCRRDCDTTTTIAGERCSSEFSPYAGNSQVSKDRGEHTIQCNHTSEVETAPCI